VGAVDQDFSAQPPDRAEQRVTEFQPSLIVKVLVLDDDRDSSTAYRLGNGSALAWGSSSRNSAATPVDVVRSEAMQVRVTPQAGGGLIDGPAR
jgi:hypothetical protein